MAGVDRSGRISQSCHVGLSPWRSGVVSCRAGNDPAKPGRKGWRLAGGLAAVCFWLVCLVVDRIADCACLVGIPPLGWLPHSGPAPALYRAGRFCFADYR